MRTQTQVCQTVDFYTVCSTPCALLCPTVFHGWADQKFLWEKIIIVIVIVIISGNKRTGGFGISRTWLPSKHTSPQVKKWGPRTLNVHGNVSNSSVLAFAKKFDPQPKLSTMAREKMVRRPAQEPYSSIIIWLRVRTESINNLYSLLLTRIMPQS